MGALVLNRLRCQPLLSLWLRGLIIISGVLVATIWIVPTPTLAAEPAPVTPASLSTLLDEGAAALGRGDYTEARTTYHAALGLARIERNEEAIARILSGLGVAYQQLGDLPAAISALSEATIYWKRRDNPQQEKNAWCAIGNLHLHMRSYQKAIEAFNACLVILGTLIDGARASDNQKSLLTKERAINLLNKHVCHSELKQWAQALDSSKMAAADFRSIGDRLQTGVALLSAGTIAYHNFKDFKESARLFSEASHLLEEVGELKLANWANLGLAEAYDGQTKFEDAIPVFTKVIEVAGREDQGTPLVLGHNGLGAALSGMGQWDEALRHFQEAFRLRRQVNVPAHLWKESDNFLHMGEVYQWLNRYEEAYELFYAAAHEYRQAQDPNGEAEALKRLGEMAGDLGDTRSAITYYKQAIEQYRATGNTLQQVEVLAALAEVSWASGNLSYEKSLELFDEGKRMLDSLAAAAGIDASAFLLESVKKRIERSRDEVINDITFAIPNFPQWLNKLSTGSSELDKNHAIALVAYIDHWVNSKHLEKEWARKVPSLGTDFLITAGVLHQKLGAVALDAGNPSLALGALSTAHLFHTSVSRDWMRGGRNLAIEQQKDWYLLGEAERKNNVYDSALHYFYLSEVAAVVLHIPEIHIVRAGLARTYADMGDFDHALMFYTSGLAELESFQTVFLTEKSKVGVLEKASTAYQEFVPLLLDLYNKTGEYRYAEIGFLVTEKQHARVFRELLITSRAARLGAESSKLSAKAEEIRREITQIHYRLTTTEPLSDENNGLLAHLEQLRERWRLLQQEASKHKDRYAQLTSYPPVTLEEVQAVLDSDSALLVYSVNRIHSALWVIARDEAQVYRLPSTDRVQALQVRAFQNTLAQPLLGPTEIATLTALGQQAYRTLLQPAESLLSKKKRLLIVPDGPLHYIPFEALIIPEPQSGDTPLLLPDVNFLVKRYEVSYVPSATAFVMHQRQMEKQKPVTQVPLLAFGDPIYEKSSGTEKDLDNKPQSPNLLVLRDIQLSRLEFSRDEVRRIAKILNIPLDSPHVNLGEHASVAHLRQLDLSQYRIVHFATHAVVGDEVEWANQPALVLSQQVGQERSSSLLRLTDITDLKLNADLVVLSACNTGLGNFSKGEGIIGLTRAFLYAGAAAVVVSLWEVEDQSTSLLMERFHRRLRQGESKSAALHGAKLDMLTKTVDLRATGKRESLASPFFWAPFILVGDWE
jgi:CHAT domain-containing protein/Flp pilus assembly protein TadD